MKKLDSVLTQILWNRVLSVADEAATGLIRPLGALVARIPDGIAAGMLAGVLLPFCLKGAQTVAGAPALILPMVALYGRSPHIRAQV